MQKYNSQSILIFFKANISLDLFLQLDELHKNHVKIK